MNECLVGAYLVGGWVALRLRAFDPKDHSLALRLPPSSLTQSKKGGGSCGGGAHTHPMMINNNDTLYTNAYCDSGCLPSGTVIINCCICGCAGAFKSEAPASCLPEATSPEMYTWFTLLQMQNLVCCRHSRGRNTLQTLPICFFLDYNSG